jgi:iron complex outermembrane recepter protein
VARNFAWYWGDIHVAFKASQSSFAPRPETFGPPPGAGLFRPRQSEILTTVTAAVLAAIYASRVLADTSAATDAATSADATDGPLQEVTVTATRHARSAQDLPMSITAVSGAALEAQGIQDIAGLAQSMAGVSYTDKGPFGGVAGANLIIRGLNSETTSGLPASASPVVPPVATYVDDTPLFVNLRLQDLDHVEVLRGPQGTLYGSGSLGGTIRFVQNAPKLDGFDAKVEMGLSDTAHTENPNEDISGMLNVPLSDTFAVRLNAGVTHDAGFINAPNLYLLNSSGVPVPTQPGNLFSPPTIYSKDGINTYQYRNVRLASLWQPNDVFHAQLSYYYQRSTADGFPYIATGLSGYNQPINPANLPVGNFTNPPALTQLSNTPVPSGVDQLSTPENGADTTGDTVNLVALTLDYEMGFATLTSSSSWAHHVNNSLADETAEYENFPAFPQDIYGQNPRMFVQGHEEFDDKPWSEEIRLVSKPGDVVEWVGGVFYRHETTAIQEDDYYPGYDAYYNACAPIYGPSPADFVTPSQCGVGDTAYVPGANTVINGVPVIKDEVFLSNFETTSTDLAGFGELTGHLTSAWSVTGGTRVFKQTDSQSQQTALLLVAAPQFGSPPTNLSTSNSWSRALWKLNTSYQLDPTDLVYATWSQGFRRGSVNALPAIAGGLVTPPSLFKVQPDTADNYEIGAKGTIANRFRYTADVFDIQWHNIQESVQLTPVVVPGVLNIGDGYSRGLELQLEAAVTDHVTTHLSYTYDQTKLTTVSPLYVFPIVSGTPPAVGSALPGTPKSSVEAGIEYGHVPLAGGELSYSVNAHYQSAVESALSATIPSVPGYTMINTRLTMAWPHWMTAVYVNNVTNILGISAYQDPAVFGNRYMAIISQPRTVGLTVGYTFK